MKINKVLAFAASLVLAGGAVLATSVAASATQPDIICTESGAGWSDKIDTSGDPATVTVNADEGFLIDAYCVKAGQTKHIVPVNPALETVVIDHPEKDSVSHYQYHQIPKPVEEDPDPSDLVVTSSYDCETTTLTITSTNNGDVFTLVSFGFDPEQDGIANYGDGVELDAGETEIFTYDLSEAVFSLPTDFMAFLWDNAEEFSQGPTLYKITISSLDCPVEEPEKPADVVVTTTDEDKDCESKTITTVTTTTTTGHVLVNNVWVPAAPVITTTSSVRDATAEECPDPTPTPTVTPTPTPTVTPTPTPTVTPTTVSAGTGGDDGLALTGGVLNPWVLTIGALFVALGVSLLVLVRMALHRRRTVKIEE